MFVLGLTGPTGAGKSLVASHLKTLGFEVIDADQIARAAVAPGECLDELAAAFGKQILLPDGSLNRKKLASIVFSDKNQLKRLNLITHLHIIMEIRRLLAELEKKRTGFVVLDAPALFESGAQSLCSQVLSVIAGDEIRLERIIRRDGITREAALERMKGQPPTEFYTAQSDFVVDSSGGTRELLAQIDDLADRFLPHKD